MSALLPGDTEGYFDEDVDSQAFGIGPAMEERLRDINSRKQALTRAKQVGLEQAELEMNKELEDFLKDNGTEAQEEKRKGWEKLLGKRRRDDEDDNGGFGGRHHRRRIAAPAPSVGGMSYRPST